MLGKHIDLFILFSAITSLFQHQFFVNNVYRSDSFLENNNPQPEESDTIAAFLSRYRNALPLKNDQEKHSSKFNACTVLFRETI